MDADTVADTDLRDGGNLKPYNNGQDDAGTQTVVNVALTVTPAPTITAVDLGTAANFAILSKSGITDVPTSVITGNIGTSPITGADILVSCPEVTGAIESVDAAGPSPCEVIDPTSLTTAVSNMQTAYTTTAGITTPSPVVNLGAGNISGMTLVPGVYKWSTDVNINSDVYLNGGANDVWIFQIAGNLNVASKGSIASGVHVVLEGGAQASNVFWQVGGTPGATLGTYSTFNGTILSATQIIMQTGAILNGRALAQTQVTLEKNTITNPTTAPKTDYTLSALTVNGVTVAGFAPTTLTYNVTLPAGTITIPTVAATANDTADGATAIVTQPTSTTGSATILVTAQDTTVSQTYTINFTVAAPVLVTGITLNMTGTGPSTYVATQGTDGTWTVTVPQDTAMYLSTAHYTMSSATVAMTGADTTKSYSVTFLDGTYAGQQYGNLVYDTTNSVWTLIPSQPQTFETAGYL